MTRSKAQWEHSYSNTQRQHIGLKVHPQSSQPSTCGGVFVFGSAQVESACDGVILTQDYKHASQAVAAVAAMRIRLLLL
jgi:hypothetical protein